MSTPGDATVPLFPLGSVVFPGVVAPLHIFEDRYVALMRHLLSIRRPGDRVFGIVAIREGYEVAEGFSDRQSASPAASRAAASVYRTGTLVQLSSVQAYPDGRYDVEVTGRQRLRVLSTDETLPYLTGAVELIEDTETPGAATQAVRTLSAFRRYRAQLSTLRGAPVLVGSMPRDPAYLSYSLAATCLLTVPQRQELLEAPDALQRLSMLEALLDAEMRAMRAVPSLPATEAARTKWSPN